MRSFSIVMGVVACLLASTAAAAPLRNVICFIGDGMGPQNLGLLLHYARVTGTTSNYERLLARGRLAMVFTNPHEHLVTDSAAGATAIACGRKTRPGMVGLDPKGRSIPTVLELAARSGRATGLIATTKLTDATPAGFSAHCVSRSDQAKIAEQQIRESRPDVLLGGGMSFWIPQGTHVSDYGKPQFWKGYGGSQRKDDQDLVAEARSKGWRTCHDLAGLETLLSERPEKVLGLFAARNMPFAIDRRRSETIPDLPTMTEAAIEILDRNRKGFFLMVEGAAIDLMAHNNDAGAMLWELLEFDRALGKALPLVERGDTFVIVTADHNTGGFGFSYNKFRNPREVPLEGGAVWRQHYDFVPDGRLMRLARQRTTLRALTDEATSPESLRKGVAENTAFTLSAEKAKRLWDEGKRIADSPMSDEIRRDGSYEDYFYPYRIGARSTLLARELGGQMGVAWSTGTHDCTLINLVAVGAGQERLRPLMDNTETFELMIRAMAIRDPR